MTLMWIIVMMKGNLRGRKSLTRSGAMVVATWKFVRPRGNTLPPPGVQLASQRRTIHFKSWQVVVGKIIVSWLITDLKHVCCRLSEANYTK